LPADGWHLEAELLPAFQRAAPRPAILAELAGIDARVMAAVVRERRGSPGPQALAYLEARGAGDMEVVYGGDLNWIEEEQGQLPLPPGWCAAACARIAGTWAGRAGAVDGCLLRRCRVGACAVGGHQQVRPGVAQALCKSTAGAPPGGAVVTLCCPCFSAKGLLSWTFEFSVSPAGRTRGWR